MSSMICWSEVSFQWKLCGVSSLRTIIRSTGSMVGAETTTGDVADSILQQLAQHPDFEQQPLATHLSQHEAFASLQQPKIVLKSAINGQSPILHSMSKVRHFGAMFKSGVKVPAGVKPDQTWFPPSRIPPPETGAYWAKKRRSGLIGMNCGLMTTCDTANACWASTLFGAACTAHRARPYASRKRPCSHSLRQVARQSPSSSH